MMSAKLESILPFSNLSAKSFFQKIASRIVMQNHSMISRFPVEISLGHEKKKSLNLMKVTWEPGKKRNGY